MHLSVSSEHLPAVPHAIAPDSDRYERFGAALMHGNRLAPAAGGGKVHDLAATCSLQTDSR